MTLHETIEMSKKGLIAVFGVIGGILLIVVLFRLAGVVNNILFPPKVQPALATYGKLPAIGFPENAATQKFTYTLNTVSGALPELPDRLNVYPITEPEANFLNLNKAKGKVERAGFVDEMGTVLPEKSLGNNTYQWTETKGIKRQMTFNIVSFNFHMVSDYLTSSLSANGTTDLTQKNAVDAAKGFLEDIGQLSDDIDLNKTLNPDKDIHHITAPQLFSIQNGILIPATSLSTTRVIKVDLYQKDITYDLNTGIPNLTGGFRTVPLVLHVFYPHPPYSPMSFWVISTENNRQVVAADFTHQYFSIPKDSNVTYALKTVDEAFNELKNGKGYIASFNGTDNTIQITNIYLGYYIGEKQQKYLMPIFVFEGDNGFFAYVSAVNDEWLK